MSTLAVLAVYLGLMLLPLGVVVLLIRRHERRVARERAAEDIVNRDD